MSLFIQYLQENYNKVTFEQSLNEEYTFQRVYLSKLILSWFLLFLDKSQSYKSIFLNFEWFVLYLIILQNKRYRKCRQFNLLLDHICEFVFCSILLQSHWQVRKHQHFLQNIRIILHCYQIPSYHYKLTKNQNSCNFFGRDGKE